MAYKINSFTMYFAAVKCIPVTTYEALYH